MRVALLGGSGLIGSALGNVLRARGDEVVVLSLREPEAAALPAAECDAVINLAGEPIAQRWNASIKARILKSRTETPRNFLKALSSLPRRCAAYVSASGIDYYGPSLEATFDEESPPGRSPLAQVCVEWEREAHAAGTLGMRVACVRTGLVLGDGGLLAKVVPLFRAGLGGRIGDGKTWYSWIHITDVVGIYVLALDGVNGPLNAVAPNPVTNAEFTQTLADVLHRPAALPTPSFAVRAMLGEGASALLDRQRVLPKRVLQLGYRFAFAELGAALENLLE